MIISHQYQYVFIQLDQTGSTAIAHELLENYGGRHLLWKHARYCDFLRVATPEEKKYFTFSGVRHPLDVAVSLYFRLKEKPRFKDLHDPTTTKDNYRQAMFIERNKADFAAFFKKFYARRLYWEWKVRGFDRLDHVYRFENLQEEFSSILKRLGINQIRPIPVLNKTPGRLPDYIGYYDTPALQRLARVVFRDYLADWGYEFPAGWAEPRPADRARYWLLKLRHILVRIIHWAIADTALYRRYVIRADRLIEK